MKLVVDIGNSRMKWLWDGPDHRAVGRSEVLPDDLDDLFAGVWSESVAPSEMLVASVGTPGSNELLQQWVQRRWQLRPEFFQATTPFPGFTNGYKVPAQLGCDRWAALIGARALCADPLCVIDCGTAITIDPLTADNVFPGGVILPGVRLTQQSLATGTSRIGDRLVAYEHVLGTTTAEGISSGSHLGLAGAIDRILLEIEATIGSTKTYITGGDAVMLLPLLRSPNIDHQPDLVLHGLLRVLEARP